MPRYIYKAKAGPQELKEGFIEADTERAAVYKLSRMGLYPVNIKEELYAESSRGASFFYKKKRVSWRALAEFMRQMSDLLASGLTIIRALEVAVGQTDNARLRAAIQDMIVFVKEGGTFSSALSRHPGIFSNIYVSMARAGETGGALEEALQRLAGYAEAEDEVRSKIRSAMAYPAFMAAAGMLTITALLTFVMPRLVAMFEDMGQSLPLPTRMLISVSNFISTYGWVVLAAALFLVFVIKRLAGTRDGRLFADAFKMKIIGLGSLIKTRDIARFTRTLSTLLSNGVPMINSLEASALTLQNEVIKRQLAQVTKDVRQGERLSSAIKKAGCFPVGVSNMIAVGDESGQLEKALAKVSDACGRNIDRATRVFTALLEPAIILVMGVVVGFIVISMLLPIFQINLIAR